MTDRAALERVDSYPYRHRVADVMTSPPVTIPPQATLGEAAREMQRRGISSLIIVDAEMRRQGIVTERDLLVAVAGDGGRALDRPVSTYAHAPVFDVEPDAYLYTAIARMDRLRLRHLAVVDPASERLVGVISARRLLHQRALKALVLGDEIAVAETGGQLAALRGRLAELAAGLLGEGLKGLELAGVVSAVLRDISARAAELAELAMTQEGHGPAPAPWSYLVLGSGGRGESLLAADQDNALVHAGRSEDDPWFAELGRRASALLDQAGIPYCKGGVMAMNPAWRHNFEGWRQRIETWVERPEGENLLSVDIFYDFRPVYGDRTLAERLRAQAMAAARARMFLAFLSDHVSGLSIPLGLFGRFITENGRLDLKKGALLPLVSGIRVLALREGVAATDTSSRLQAVGDAGLLNADDVAGLGEAHELFTRLILEQQVVDIGRVLPPSTRVELQRLKRATRRHLREALKLIQMIDWIVRDALTEK